MNRPQVFRPEDLPQDWRNFIEGTLRGTELTPVCQKILSKTDTDFRSRSGRIALPHSSSLGFLREDELATVSLPVTTRRTIPKSVPVRVIGPSRKMHLLNFTINKGREDGANSNEQYCLRQVSREFLTVNDLKKDNEVQFWSFRAMENQREELHMAMVVVGRPLDPEPFA